MTSAENPATILRMEAAEFIEVKYGDLAVGGWSPRMRRSFGYLNPDDQYEMRVAAAVTPETDWLDVGCGRLLFAGNMGLAARLAERCKSLGGIDPSPNILENELLQHREQCFLQAYHPGRKFDLVTMRMVVEHIEDPEGAAAALARLVRPGGKIIIYTVNKWSPVSMMSAVTPLPVHLVAKRILWGGEDRDTFSTVYKMNTRNVLRRLMDAHGFRETAFEYLPDTRTLAQFRATCWAELALWRVLRAIGITYPENCLLGTYTRQDA